MEIDILVADEFKRRVTKRFLSDVAVRVLTAEGAGDNVEMGILITTQEVVHELNRTYRNIDKPTDVLSFYMQEEISPGTAEAFVTPPDDVRRLGEVIISYPQAVHQAREHRHTVRRELTILLVHGILHLLGYDHEKTADAQRMQARAAAILESIREITNYR